MKNHMSFLSLLHLHVSIIHKVFGFGCNVKNLKRCTFARHCFIIAGLKLNLQTFCWVTVTGMTLCHQVSLISKMKQTILQIISWCLSSITHPTPQFLIPSVRCKWKIAICVFSVMIPSVQNQPWIFVLLLWFSSSTAGSDAAFLGLSLCFFFFFLMQMVFLCGLYQSRPPASSWRTEVWLLYNQPSAPRLSGKGVCPLVLRWESRCSTFTFSPLDLVCHLGVARIV